MFLEGATYYVLNNFIKHGFKKVQKQKNVEILQDSVCQKLFKLVYF